MIRGPYRVHPARIVLGEHGYTVSAVALAAGISTGAVTRQLSGENNVSEPVRSALVSLIGEDGTAEVLAAIPSREQAAA